MLQNCIQRFYLLIPLALISTACTATFLPATEASTPTAISVLPSVGPADPSQPTATPPTNTAALAFNPADGSLLKADSTGLSRLAADSKSWQVIVTPAPAGLNSIALSPNNSAELYVSGLSAGVLKSTDGGQTWGAVNSGLPSTDVSVLAMHSFRYETLFAWLWNDGIYRTEDGGATWKRMPDQGTPSKEVRGLVHSTLPGSMNTGWLYASTPSGPYLSMDCF